jgi:hypothetical protein
MDKYRLRDSIADVILAGGLRVGRGWWGFAGALVCLSASVDGTGVACGDAGDGLARLVAGTIETAISDARQSFTRVDIIVLRSSTKVSMMNERG